MGLGKRAKRTNTCPWRPGARKSGECIDGFLRQSPAPCLFPAAPVRPSVKLRLLPLLSFALIVACDCDDDDDDGVTPMMDMASDADPGPDAGDAGPTEPLSPFALDYADAYCAKLAECYGPVTKDLSIPDCNAATAGLLMDAYITVWRESESAGYVTIDATGASACVSAMESIACSALAPGQLLVDGCEALLEPQASTGGACLGDHDCSAGDYCFLGDSCPGSCTTYAAVGASCADAACEPSAVCNDGLQCEARAGLGDACDVAEACAGLLFCEGDGTTNVCRAVGEVFTVAEGQPCQLSIAGPFCEPGLSCVVEGDGYACRPKVDSGEACVSGFPDPCPDGEICVTVDGVSGTCTPFAGAGSDCSVAICGPGLVCGEVMAQTCIPLSDISESCAEDIACHSLSCLDGFCAAPACSP